MDQITVEDVQAAWNQFVAKLLEYCPPRPAFPLGPFGPDGPPLQQWANLVGQLIAGDPADADAVVSALSHDLMPALRSNAGEAARDASGNATAQGLSNPVDNLYDTVSDWTDAAGIDFRNKYLRGQHGLRNKLQYQYEFGAALITIMQTQQAVLLYARAGAIDVLESTTQKLHGAIEDSKRHRNSVMKSLANAVIGTAANLVTGQWIEAAKSAVTGFGEAVVTDLTWPGSGNPVDICARMVEHFSTLYAEIEERAKRVDKAISTMRANLYPEELMVPRTATPAQLRKKAAENKELPLPERRSA